MEPLERPANDLLMWELRRVGLWAQRLDGNGTGFTVTHGTDLHTDDAALGDHALSHAAWSALSHAVDHLHALRTLLEVAGVSHSFAPYTLLRAAIENSAMAVWLLTPDMSTERITRRLQQAADDIRASEDVKELIQQTGPRSREERLDDLRTIARSQGIDVKAALKAPGFRLIVRTAGEEVESGGTLAQAMWHVGSGTSHGDLWATLSVGKSPARHLVWRTYASPSGWPR